MYCIIFPQAAVYLWRGLRLLHQHQMEVQNEAVDNATKTDHLTPNVHQLQNVQQQTIREESHTAMRHIQVEVDQSIARHRRQIETQRLQNKIGESCRAYTNLHQQVGESVRPSTPSEIPCQNAAETRSTPNVDLPRRESIGSPTRVDNQDTRGSRHSTPIQDSESLQYGDIRRNSTSAHGPIRRHPKFDAYLYRRYKEVILLLTEAHAHASNS